MVRRASGSGRFIALSSSPPKVADNNQENRLDITQKNLPCPARCQLAAGQRRGPRA
ncbi:hypothetical protein VARIO8X_50170 [Burkholderiales bacterium 8X]|nr:hypothetical protein VARIO8X_50170 [Burkholderiales bacterium 8X]